MIEIRKVYALPLILFCMAAACPVEARSGLERFLNDVETEVTLRGDFGRQRNPDLDELSDDALDVFRPRLSLEIDYRPSDNVHGFMELEAESNMVLSRGNDRTSPTTASAFNLKEAYLNFGAGIEGLSLRVGRQEFEDRREWLYDEALDGIRLLVDGQRWSLAAAAARQGLFTEDLLANDRPDVQTDNYIVSGQYRIDDNHTAGIYVITRQPRRLPGNRQHHSGAWISGEYSRDVRYWLDLARVTGRESSEAIRGYAIDSGATRIFDTWLQPSITVGIAFGSGRRSADGEADAGFRQTGLQDNSFRFNGVENFRFYGEALDPELSNLGIATLGFGIRPSRRSSVDLIFHEYRQHRASAGRIRNARIRAETRGESRDVGSAIDLVIGFHEISSFRLGVKLGWFRPGGAFAEGSTDAYSLEVGFRYRF